MALKRPQKYSAIVEGPFFIFPGKEVFLRAWSLFVFSAIFAVLFNAFYSDGIEIKVNPSKPSNFPSILQNNSSKALGYSGWKNPATKTPKNKPTPTPPLSSHLSRVSVMGAKDRFDKKDSVFLDARKPEEYQEGHIPGSLNFYGNELDKFVPIVVPQLTDKNKEILVYCHGGDCDLSLMVAQSLVDMGYTHVEIFGGGWPDWKKAGYPIQSGAAP